MTTATERFIKLLDNREEMDVRVLFLQFAFGERTNSKALWKTQSERRATESIKMSQCDCLKQERMAKELKEKVGSLLILPE